MSCHTMTLMIMIENSKIHFQFIEISFTYVVCLSSPSTSSLQVVDQYFLGWSFFINQRSMQSSAMASYFTSQTSPCNIQFTCHNTVITFLFKILLLKYLFQWFINCVGNSSNTFNYMYLCICVVIIFMIMGYGHPPLPDSIFKLISVMLIVSYDVSSSSSFLLQQRSALPEP